MIGNLKAVLSEEISTAHRAPRYVLINSENGNVVDDAGGYGYSSARNAYRSFGYCHPGYGRSGSRRRSKEITSWMRHHPDLVSQLNRMGRDTDLHESDVQRKLMECEIYDLPFSIHELTREYVRLRERT